MAVIVNAMDDASTPSFVMVVDATTTSKTIRRVAQARGQGFQALSRAWQKRSTFVQKVLCQPAQPENIIQGAHKQQHQAQARQPLPG
jgi:hypothetical protein